MHPDHNKNKFLGNEALYPDLVLKKEDRLRWLAAMMGDLNTTTRERLKDKKVVLSFHEDVYEQGYKDGFEGVHNSLLWNDPEYQMGWNDGDGDKLMEND
jgi:hypothetical protein